MKIPGLATRIAPSTALVVALAGFPISAMAGPDQPSPRTPSSPSVENARVQPRGQDFMPHSADDETIQRRLSIFNEQQSLEDIALDKKLKICRGC